MSNVFATTAAVVALAIMIISCAQPSTALTEPGICAANLGTYQTTVGVSPFYTNSDANMLYNDCVDTSCACLCAPGNAGSQICKTVESKDHPNFNIYASTCTQHCTDSIRFDRCAGHGDVPDANAPVNLRVQYFDFDWYRIPCKCDPGWIGDNVNFVDDPLRISPPGTLQERCLWNINRDICNGHGTAAVATQSLMYNQLSHVVCVCDPLWTTAPGHGPRDQCSLKLPCPLINGLVCGGPTLGTCTTATATCVCNAGLGGATCCPAPGGHVCNGHGTCGTASACTCSAGFGGAYCCIQTSSQTKACGQNGDCNSDGTCHCHAGWGGSACDNPLNCPSSNPALPCSGFGVCTHYSDCSPNGICTPYNSLEYLVLWMNLVDDPNVAIVVQGTQFTDEGYANFMMRITQNYFGMGVQAAETYIQAATHTFYPCVRDLAANGWPVWLQRTQCFVDELRTLITTRQTPFPDRATALAYAARVLALDHPYFGSFDGTYESRAVDDMMLDTVLHPDQNGRVKAYISLMMYEFFRDPASGAVFYPNPSPTPSPIFDAWLCNCTAPPANAIAGTTRAYGSPTCGATCPVGLNGQVCSGMWQGIMRGQCDSNSSSCICTPHFAGAGCEQPLDGLCFPLAITSTTSQLPCTGVANGHCVAISRNNFGVPFVAHFCQCAATWTGTYCERSVCAALTDDAVQQGIECNNLGFCVPPTTTSAAHCTCDVAGQLSLSQDPNSPPLLPVGLHCEINGIAQCGTTTVAGGGFVTWHQCNDQGVCTLDSHGVPFCKCKAGASGVHCEFNVCSPACSGNTVCNPNGGHCVCKPLWSSPAVGCPDITAGSCFCSQHPCVHGIPAYKNATTSTGAYCKCDAHWTLDSHGFCTVLQCPLVSLALQGERPCGTRDSQCSSISNSPQTRTESLTTGCCYDACGSSCSQNKTTGALICACSPSIAFTQSAGVCYSKCHGQPFTVIGNSLLCDCRALQPLLAPNQFTLPGTCKIITCSNGGSPDGSGGCVCPVPWKPPYCTEDMCGERGQLNAARTACTCYPPFRQANPTDKLCLADSCIGGQTQLASQQLLGMNTTHTSFNCTCPKGTLLGPGDLSCLALNCSSPSQRPACTACLHGGKPYVSNHAIACDCRLTRYTGAQCQNIVCDRFGTAFRNQTGCTCKFPFAGQYCEQTSCVQGRPSIIHPTSANQIVNCSCSYGWSGKRCDNFTGDLQGHTEIQVLAIIHAARPLSISASSSSTAGQLIGSSSSSTVGFLNLSSSSTAVVLEILSNSTHTSSSLSSSELAAAIATPAAVVGVMAVVAVAYGMKWFCFATAAGKGGYVRAVQGAFPLPRG